MLVPRRNATPRAGILVTEIFDSREESGLWRSLGPAMRKSNTEGSLRCRSLNPTEVPSARTTGDACRVRAPFPDGVRRSPRPNSRPTEPAMAICSRPYRGSRLRTRILPYNRVVVTASGRRRVIDYVFTIVISRLAATVGRLIHLVGASAELPHAERPDVVRREPFDRISEQEAVSDRSVFDPHRVRSLASIATASTSHSSGISDRSGTMFYAAQKSNTVPVAASASRSSVTSASEFADSGTHGQGGRSTGPANLRAWTWSTARSDCEAKGLRPARSPRSPAECRRPRGCRRRNHRTRAPETGPKFHKR